MRVSHMDAIERVDNDGLIWRPVRRHFGITAFGVNGCTGAMAGDVVIEPHDESSPNAGGHEELYLVTAGRARFMVDGEAIDAPTGTLLFISPGEHREAVAAEPETTVLVIGGTPGAALPTSPFEYWYAAQPHVATGDYERAIEVASEGLTDHPDNGGLRYQLACYCALNGQGAEAVAHLARAFAADPRTRAWAGDDADLDSLRDRADYPS